MHFPRSLTLVGALCLAVCLGLSGCAATVHMDAASDASNPACSEMTVALPHLLDDQAQRSTDAASTSAWGDPAEILYRCGVTPPGPSTLPCQSVQGVDWLVNDTQAPEYELTSYGRDPAVQLYIDSAAVTTLTVLDTISPIIAKHTEVTRSCQ